MNDYILELHDIVKTFGSSVALNGMHFQLKPGEVHALMGENGAGKSTFIKVITGVYSADSGEIIYDGEKISPKNTIESQNLGIAAAATLASANKEYDGKINSSFTYNSKKFTTLPTTDGGSSVVALDPYIFHKGNIADWIDVL